MVKIPSFLLNRKSSDYLLFTVPGCTKCKKAESKLNEMAISFQSYNIFEHRSLLQDVPIEKKRQGFPLLKMHNVYYTYKEIMELEKEQSG
ncbi:hypothetical protein A1A1_14154 [Planococcus antarcticus DSM 14505]|uniref:Glutaredoxin domain-containing protein n=1 Tax=Planococcus antarcticus DSM 14505 TaxID=1185653 RepID=A0AA87IJG0_9BACL|nr:glutaredoxin domain-containing protein [Planococcus antarcticus]EIM05826.1 hypothetical protein A1A1_14154 [Planococcus antarcticus DSM 14505]